ncbi:MAG: phosphoheptose isomerase [Hadesarchaea archaeon]|nr:MAG: phosphoheptose isomerase [Hadesarchaea archaeon]TDA35998.1 MAG: phosphoheptose isomerase [Hadesarchaea archaeon]
MRRVRELLEESLAVKGELCRREEELKKVVKAAEMVVKALRRGRKVVFFGNGGSAADAQHLACELSGRFRRERRGLPALALTVNTSSLTAIANDYGYEKVFSRQVEGLVEKGDVVVGISTSGESENVIEGLKEAKRKGAFTVGLCGEGGRMEKFCDLCIKVPSKDTPRIQEAHITLGHILCELVEREMFG